MDPQALDAAIESALTRLGYENLRPMQKLAVQSFVQLQGWDVFVSLPTQGTGSGKSLCYIVAIAVGIRAPKRYCLLYCDRR